MKSGSWRWAVMLVVVMSMVGATAVLAQKAPTPRSQESTPNLASGQVTPLAVETFHSKVEPVDGTDKRTHLAYELRLTNYDAFLGGAVAQISPEQRGEQRDRLPPHRTVNEFR